MRRSNSSRPAPRPFGLFLLAALVFCAAAVLRSRLAPPAQTPDASAVSGPPPAISLTPPGRQGEFSLLAVTRAQNNYLERPKTAAKEDFDGGGRSASADTTGLWIQAVGGIGVSKVAARGGRTLYPLVGGQLAVISPEPVNGVLRTEWLKMDGVTRSETTPPYFVQLSKTRDWLYIIPKNVSVQFDVTAQPLDAGGKAFGKPVTLACDPAGAALLFVALPAGYSARTQEFDVTIRRHGGTSAARWRIGNLPRPAPTLPPPSRWTTQFTMGNLAVQARAWESPDQNLEDFDGSHPQKLMLNLDRHVWTGVPTVVCRIDVTPAQNIDPTQEWDVGIKEIRLPWQSNPPPPPTAVGAFSAPAVVADGSPRGVGIARPAAAPVAGTLPSGGGSPGNSQVFMPLVSLSLLALTSVGGNSERVQHWEASVGVAYPGQQKFARVRGVAVRYRNAAETLTFHDADARWDDRAKRWRLFWTRAQTQTTPSGISVKTLDFWPGGKSFDFLPAGSADCALAERVPPGFSAPGDLLHQTTPIMAQFPTLEPPLIGTAAAVIPDWVEVWMPGVPLPVAPGGPRHTPMRLSPVYPLMRAHWELMALPVSSPAAPLPNGPAAPRHFDALTLKISRRVEVERRPFTLFVPVHASPQKGP